MKKMVLNIIFVMAVLTFICGLIIMLKYHPLVGLFVSFTAGSVVAVCMGHHWSIIVASMIVTLPVLVKALSQSA